MQSATSSLKSPKKASWLLSEVNGLFITAVKYSGRTVFHLSQVMKLFSLAKQPKLLEAECVRLVQLRWFDSFRQLGDRAQRVVAELELTDRHSAPWDSRCFTISGKLSERFHAHFWNVRKIKVRSGGWVTVAAASLCSSDQNKNMIHRMCSHCRSELKLMSLCFENLFFDVTAVWTDSRGKKMQVNVLHLVFPLLQPVYIVLHDRYNIHHSSGCTWSCLVEVRGQWWLLN